MEAGIVLSEQEFASIGRFNWIIVSDRRLDCSRQTFQQQREFQFSPVNIYAKLN